MFGPKCQALTSSGAQCNNTATNEATDHPPLCNQHFTMWADGKALDFVDGSHQPEMPGRSATGRRAEKKVPCRPKSARS